MATDLSKFKGRLPYDSQLYGIYQPLIGWRSRLIQNRLNAIPLDLPPFPPQADVMVGGNKDVTVTLRGSHQSFRVMADGTVQGDHAADLFKTDPNLTTFDNPGYVDSLLVRLVQQDVKQNLPAHPPTDTAFWSNYWTNMLSVDSLNKVFNKALESLHTPLVAEPTTIPPDTDPLGQYVYKVRLLFGDPAKANEYLFNKEVYVARYLNSLLPGPGADAAAASFPLNVNDLLLNATAALDVKAALELLDPLHLAAGIGREAVLSPIGLIHIFRQYYFEFDTFLGAPVEHVWLSPGSTTEMIEISTRRVLQEYTLEQLTEIVQTSETSTTTSDELSNAVQDENQKNTKLGASLSGGVNILVANIQASGSTSVDETQKTARQDTHKTSRQQTAKLSSQIRSSFKSTFRTVTESTDTRSKRYTITNSTNDLINYELRRKMRQIGVQVQDFGTQLCWQVYVDDAGSQLGVAQLVHVAAKSDLSPYVHAPLNPTPDPNGVVNTMTILVPVPNPGDRSNLGPIAAGAIGFVASSVPGAVVGVAVYDVVDSLFGGGKDKSNSYDIGPTSTIHQQYKITMPDGYQLAQPAQQVDPDNIFTKDPSGEIPIRWLQNNGRNLRYHMTILSATDGVMDMVVNGGSVSPAEIIEFQAMIRVVPTADKIAAAKQENDKIAEENAQKDIAKERAIRQDFVNGVKERVKFAAGIKARNADDLREEERTVIYRALLQRLMNEAWSLQVDRKVAHLRSELIKSIFDVDRMLYFVAPEWWQPRLHESRLDVTMPQYGMNIVSRTALSRLAAGGKAIAAPLKQDSGDEALATQDLADWGGEGRTDNYMITEDSDSARLGSSLGWLLQLDGDNLRNAFLNAPWVNAIIPILPGREQQAIEWLKQAEVEGAEGLDDLYAGDDKEAFKAKYQAKYGVAKDPTIEDTLLLTADDIQKKQQAAFDVIKEDVPLDGGGNGTISYLRQDQVFEKGFDPLQDGFKVLPQKDQNDKTKPLLEVFDQWIEILPTDQVVAVPVAYDPKTGLLK